MNFIGICGFKGSGKDTVANYFIEAYGAIRRSFADPLREEVLAAFPGLTMDDLTDREKKETPNQHIMATHCLDLAFADVMMGKPGMTEYTACTPRAVMQWWGTEYRRGQNDNYWLDRFVDFALDCRLKGIPMVVCADMRFLNEATLLRNLGATLINVIRDEVTPADELLPKLHRSETEHLLIQNDFELYNNDDMASLKNSWASMTHSITFNDDPVIDEEEDDYDGELAGLLPQ